MLAGRPWEEWIAQYAKSHQHPVNRLCHTIGIPLIAVSVPLFLGLSGLAVPVCRAALVVRQIERQSVIGVRSLKFEEFCSQKTASSDKDAAKIPPRLGSSTPASGLSFQ
jgi:hypothetical protein